jgi:hypothetical protein
MKYRTIAPQEHGWSDWIVPTDNELRIVCCDCKLAHDFEFQVVDSEVAFRAKRNDRATAQLRRKVPSPRNLVPRQEEEICRRYLLGESLRELAAAFDCSQHCIDRAIRRLGIAARSNSEASVLRERKKVRSCAPRRLMLPQVADVCRRYQAGESLRKLADAFGCHRREIERALAVLRIEKRSFAEACALRGQKHRRLQAPRSSKSVQPPVGSAQIGQDPHFAALDTMIMTERCRIRC